MSAGYGEPKVQNDLGLLAPRFSGAICLALQACENAGYDAIVFESYRSNELQELYYERGRTVIPPKNIVTNAKTNIYSWHGFGLAVDIISKSKEWSQPHSWFKSVSDIFKQYDCKWGGDWKQADLPHMQWGLCKPSPSDAARQLLQDAGQETVWRTVGAL